MECVQCNFPCSDGRLFVGILHYSEHFTDQFITKLEDRIAEVVDQMSGSDLTLVRTSICHLYVITLEEMFLDQFINGI